MMDLLEVKIYLDGDQWCAMVGEDIQSGVAGFGDTPLQALIEMVDSFYLQPWNLDHVTLG